MAESRALDFSGRREERRGPGRVYGRAGPGVVRMADTSRGQGRLQGQEQGQGQDQWRGQGQGRVQGQGQVQGHDSVPARPRKRDRTGLSLSLQGDCVKQQVSR